MTAGRPSDTGYFDRWDLAAIITLTAVASVLRFFSPILPNLFLPGNTGPAISNCVSSTPIDAPGDLGTLCGLAYPFNKGYKDANGQLSPPNGQVFDEIWFTVDAYYDVKGIEKCSPANGVPGSLNSCPYNYIDPEPPLAKEFIGLGEWGYGWYRAHFQGASGDYIDLGDNTFGWRIAVCIFGTLCIPMMYLLARRLWPSRLFAIAAATLVCFDGMFFVQSRIGMIDIFPIFFILFAYFLFLVHIQSHSFKGAMISLLALGVVLGIGIASKWIVLAAWLSICFWLVARVVLRRTSIEVGPSYVGVALIALLAIPAGIYLASWYPFFARGQFHTFQDLVAYTQWSFDYHRTLTATHPFGSRPWSWPFLMRPVLYYAQYDGLGTDAFTGEALWARISNLGNPWIWWTSLPAVAALPYYVFRQRSFAAAVILLGFVTQYAPWFLISRVLFMYHMFGGLIFMVLALAFVLAQLAQKLPRPGRQLLVAAHLAVAVLVFGYFYPNWTALPISQSAWYEGQHTPPWGPKLWLLNCQGDPALVNQIFCWN